MYMQRPTVCLTFKLNKKSRLTNPAIGVGSLLTLLIVPGLILLIRLRAKERERENVRERKRVSESPWSLARLVDLAMNKKCCKVSVLCVYDFV